MRRGPLLLTGDRRQRPHLHGLRPEELDALIRGVGVEPLDGDSRRMLAHAISHGLPGYPERRPVSRAVRRAVDRVTRRDPLVLLEREEDPEDGFVRYLFQAPDGARFEAVRIPLHREDRYSVCLSSQVGCGLACDFCATGRLGLTRNLLAWEMVSSFMAVRDDIAPPGRVTGAVFMGQGEPLLNERQVLRAAAVLRDPCGGRIAAGAISISTAGVVPAIRRYTAARHPYRLIVSLTSAIQARRDALMPGAARWPLDELAAAIRDHARVTSGRATVAWVVLGGVNTGPDEVDALRALLGDVPLRLNLIDVNDPRPGGHRRATSAELSAFRDRLQVLGVPVVRRYSGGAATHAACGMLASRRRTVS